MKSALRPGDPIPFILVCLVFLMAQNSPEPQARKSRDFGLQLA
jgi:hypothetical protein